MRKLLFSFFIFIQIHLPLNIFSQNSENDSTLLKFNNDTTISISIGDSITISNEIDTTYIEVKKIKEGNKNKIEINEKLISNLQDLMKNSQFKKIMNKTYKI